MAAIDLNKKTANHRQNVKYCVHIGRVEIVHNSKRELEFA